MFEFSNESKTAKQMLHRLRVQSSLLSKLFFVRTPANDGKHPGNLDSQAEMSVRVWKTTVRDWPTDRPTVPTDR